LRDIVEVLGVSIVDLVRAENESEIEEQLAFCMQGIRQQNPSRQRFLLEVLENLIEKIEEIK